MEVKTLIMLNRLDRPANSPILAGMRLRFGCWLGVLILLALPGAQGAEQIETAGRLPNSSSTIAIWWALSSAAKIRPDTAPPEEQSTAVQIRCARHEWESVQVVVRPTHPLRNLTIEASSFTGTGHSVIFSNDVEILRAVYVNVTTPTDKSATGGLWPDPLIPMKGGTDLEPEMNHAFWMRVYVPGKAAAGVYRGSLRMRAEDWHADLPVELTVYDFTLPDQMTCQTALGFSPNEVFRYHGLPDETSKREVLEKYWADLAAHHISPYDPAPLNEIKVTWPDVHPPKSQWDQWRNLRLVQNEVHSGKSALLVYDDQPNENVVVSYWPLISIPPGGLHLRGWYRTAIPGHRFTVSLNHYDAKQDWISGHNRDFVLQGSGQWQFAEYQLSEFPAEAKYVRLNLMATEWTDAGEKLGLVWFDDLSLQDSATGRELIQGGDFEKVARTELCAPAEALRPTLDFSAWDQAMTQALDFYHFNSYSVSIPGMGGGTFYELVQPSLLGFGEDSPEYPLLLGSYCGQIEAHLRAKGWLDKAYIYWFDEPNEGQYAYLQNGFGKLKRFCPGISRMITKLVEPGLVGGPNLWCPISDQYNHERAEERRKLGERFWWYVCTGPKAPYAGLFLDHRAPEMRLWLWQSFQRHINGILVWQCNYWTSSTANPDPKQPQNPYQDPMSWTSGYGTPLGKKLPWGNGDGRFIYPPVAASSGNPLSPVLEGPVDSIRWEQLRDGIEDYEYLTILRQKLDRRGATLDPGTFREYERLLTVPENITRSMTEFAPDGAPIELRRHQIARAIEKL